MFIGVYAYIYTYMNLKLYVMHLEETMYRTSRTKLRYTSDAWGMDAHSDDIRNMALKDTINRQILLGPADTCKWWDRRGNTEWSQSPPSYPPRISTRSCNHQYRETAKHTAYVETCAKYCKILAAILERSPSSFGQDTTATDTLIRWRILVNTFVAQFLQHSRHGLLLQ